MRRSYKGSQFNSGQSLIEVIIGIAIAAMLTISLISVGLITNRSSRSAKNTAQATKLAQEKIEDVRVIRDRRGYTYVAGLTRGVCHKTDAPTDDPITWSLITISPCPETVPGPAENVTFTRSIVLSDSNPVDADKRLVTVTVNWNEPGGARSVKNQTLFTRWDQLP